MSKGWYVVHTFSGHEQKIEKLVRRQMEIDEDFASVCSDVKVPFEVLVENKDGKYLVYAECLDKYKVLPKKGTYNENLVLNIDNRFEIITDGKKHPGEILRLEF